MQARKWITAVLGFCLLALAGCSKSAAPTGSSVEVIDASKLRPAFASASAETQATVDAVMLHIQDSHYPGALAELDKLARTAGLTDAQRTVINDLAQQIKKKLTPAAPP